MCGIEFISSYMLDKEEMKLTRYIVLSFLLSNVDSGEELRTFPSGC